jgi:hypothetical protein
MGLDASILTASSTVSKLFELPAYYSSVPRCSFDVHTKNRILGGAAQLRVFRASTSYPPNDRRSSQVATIPYLRLLKKKTCLSQVEDTEHFQNSPPSFADAGQGNSESLPIPQ